MNNKNNKNNSNKISIKWSQKENNDDEIKIYDLILKYEGTTDLQSIDIYFSKQINLSSYFQGFTGATMELAGTSISALILTGSLLPKDGSETIVLKDLPLPDEFYVTQIITSPNIGDLIFTLEENNISSCQNNEEDLGCGCGKGLPDECGFCPDHEHHGKGKDECGFCPDHEHHGKGKDECGLCPENELYGVSKDECGFCPEHEHHGKGKDECGLCPGEDNYNLDLCKGCTDPEAFNYDPTKTINDGSCVDVIEGCIDQSANNYNELANTDNGSCEYSAVGDLSGEIISLSTDNILTFKITNSFEESKTILSTLFINQRYGMDDNVNGLQALNESREVSIGDNQVLMKRLNEPFKKTADDDVMGHYVLETEIPANLEMEFKVDLEKMFTKDLLGIAKQITLEVDINGKVSEENELDNVNEHDHNIVKQRIELVSGLNYISTYVDNDGTDLLNNANVTEVKDLEGNVYQQNASALATLNKLQPGIGYMVTCNNGVTIDLEGELVISPIELDEGWNLIGSGQNTDLDPSTISGAAMIIGDNQIYDSSLELNTLGNLTPGKAYWIFVEEGTDFCPECTQANEDAINGSYEGNSEGNSYEDLINKIGEVFGKERLTLPIPDRETEVDGVTYTIGPVSNENRRLQNKEDALDIIKEYIRTIDIKDESFDGVNGKTNFNGKGFLSEHDMILVGENEKVIDNLASIDPEIAERVSQGGNPVFFHLAPKDEVTNDSQYTLNGIYLEIQRRADSGNHPEAEKVLKIINAVNLQASDPKASADDQIFKFNYSNEETGVYNGLGQDLGLHHLGFFKKNENLIKLLNDNDFGTTNFAGLPIFGCNVICEWGCNGSIWQLKYKTGALDFGKLFLRRNLNNNKCKMWVYNEDTAKKFANCVDSRMECPLLDGIFRIIEYALKNLLDSMTANVDDISEIIDDIGSTDQVAEDVRNWIQDKVYDNLSCSSYVPPDYTVVSDEFLYTVVSDEFLKK